MAGLLALWLSGVALAAEGGPVVLVPGLASTQLMLRLGPGYEPKHGFCNETHGKWFRSWINLEEFLPGVAECFMHRMMTPWNASGPYDLPGVESRVDDWGGTASIETLDPALAVGKDAVKVFADLVELFVKRGYEKGTTLRGAPFDWRYSGPSATGRAFVARLQGLIEETAVAQGGRVLILSHSLGGKYVLQMLRKVSPAWQDKYLRGWVSVSTPFGGSETSLRSIISGYNEGIVTIPDDAFVHTERTWSTLWWTLPDPRVFGDKVLARNATFNFTAANYSSLFADVEYDAQQKLLATNAAWRNETFAPVHTPLHCFLSTGYKMLDEFHWPGAMTKQPELTWSLHGDGSVNDLSLRVCLGMQPETVHEYVGIEHLTMIQNKTVLNDLAALAGPPKGPATVVV